MPVIWLSGIRNGEGLSSWINFESYKQGVPWEKDKRNKSSESNRGGDFDQNIVLPVSALKWVCVNKTWKGETVSLMLLTAWKGLLPKLTRHRVRWASWPWCVSRWWLVPLNRKQSVGWASAIHRTDSAEGEIKHGWVMWLFPIMQRVCS